MKVVINNANRDNEKSDPFKKFDRFGKYQLIQYLLICISLSMVSMTHVNYIFVAENVDYRCRVPQCEGENSTVHKPSWWPEDIDPKCYKPIIYEDHLSNETCSNFSFTGVAKECQEWIYENNNSIIADLNLACQPWKVNLVGTVHNAGMFFSSLFSGWIADKFGRKPTLIICAVGASIGVIKIFLTQYYAYLAVELLESVIGSGLYTICIVLMSEVGGSSHRVLAGVISSYAVYVGEIVCALLAMGLQYWKWLILVIYAPLALLVFYLFILKESTRWQILRGHVEEAKKTLAIIAKINKIEITAVELEKICDEELRAKLQIEEQRDGENFKAIIGSKEIMTRLAVVSFCFFTASFLYYGSIIHTALLPGNKQTNFVLCAVVSFPGELIAYYTFNKYGRRITLQCGYILSAVFIIAQSYCPATLTWLKILLFVIAKFGVVICFTGIYTYSLELFPTSVRGTLLGCANTIARLGSMLAPLTPLLITEVEALPSILFASTAVVSALLAIFTPETKTSPMFDTIAQIEAYKNSISKL